MIIIFIFAVGSLGSLLLVFSLGENFFAYVDSGQMQFHVRPPSGTRIEVAIQIFSRILQQEIAMLKTKLAGLQSVHPSAQRSA